MTPETLAALRGSIKKWEGIVGGTGYDYGMDNCPLCKMFYNETKIGSSCNGCPVREATGSDLCMNSPYVFFACAKNENRINFYKSDECKRLAQAELDFLISLLPEGEKP